MRWKTMTTAARRTKKNCRRKKSFPILISSESLDSTRLVRQSCLQWANKANDETRKKRIETENAQARKRLWPQRHQRISRALGDVRRTRTASNNKMAKNALLESQRSTHLQLCTSQILHCGRQTLKCIADVFHWPLQAQQRTQRQH